MIKSVQYLHLGLIFFLRFAGGIASKLRRKRAQRVKKALRCYFINGHRQIGYNYSLARCTTVYVEECPEPVPDTLEVCLDVTESECVAEDQEVR